MSKHLVKVREIIDEISMGPFGSDIKVEYFVKSGIPVLNGYNISSVRLKDGFDNFVTEERAATYKKAIAKRGDIVITHRGTLGQIAYIPTDSLFDRYVISQSQFKVRLNPDKVNPIYFTYYFHTTEGQKRLLSFKSHVGVPALAQATTNFRLIEFPLIPLKEQNSIASLLELLDNKIELNNRINAELDAMAKTLYDFWFVQFDFPDANGKPYKTSGGKMVYNPTLKREIPEGWGVCELGEVLDKSPSSTRIQSTDYSKVGDIPIIDQSQDFICGFTEDESSKIAIPPKDAHIVFGDHTRIVKLINFDYARGADGTQILISNKDNLSNFLLYQMVSDIDLSNYGYARHYKFLKQQKIILPDIKASASYHSIVATYFEKCKVNIFENIELEKLRDWLLPMLMNGQVTVNS